MIRFLGFAALACYAAYGAVMIALHPRFIYPFSQEPFARAGFHAVDLPTPGTGPLRVQVHIAALRDAPVVLIFMGNAGALAEFMPMLEVHLAADRTIVAMEYRGGGGLPGTPSERQLKQDALAVFDHLPDLTGRAAGPVFVHGYSLGTGLALHVAVNRPVAGVMLDAPYARLCEVMASVSYLPACQLPFVQRWDSLSYAGQIAAPVLIQHGTADQRIPIGQARALADGLRRGGTRVDLIERAGGTHVNLAEFPDYGPAIAAFLRAVTPG